MLEKYRPRRAEMMTPASIAADGEIRILTRACIAELPPKQRRAIILWLDGFSHAEIAAKGGCTESQSKQRVYDAKESLRANPSTPRL